MRYLGTTLRARSLDIALGGALLLLILLVYAPAYHYGFVDYDDSFYVPNNPRVLAGLTGASLRWAFTSTDFGNWFPLTWISYMADRQWFASADEILPAEVRAGAYHVTNVILHGVGAWLLFWLLKRTTGRTGASWMVAFLFALHPLRVESVAWVAERKDVLSGVFWMLALHAYVSYSRRPRAATYLLTLALCCLGFMAKPMVVTLPLVLALFDFWPLDRSEPDGRKLFWEKAPFFLLAAVMSLVTFAVQKQAGAVRTLGEMSLYDRLGNALVSAAVYIAKTFWPTRLAALYPILKLPLWQVVLAALVLAGITILALRTIPTRPYLAVGWFWYLITLLPVIGIVQVGLQARADRYTYIPTIGLYIMAVWTAEEGWRRWPKLRSVIVGFGAAVCLACVILTARQIPYWQDSVTLFRHAIEVTGPNAYAHGYLGDTFRAQLLYEQAAGEYRKGLAISPENVGLLVDLGDALDRSGSSAEAIAPLNQAIRLAPDDPVIHNFFGTVLQRAGRIDEALVQFTEAVRLKPDDETARRNLEAAEALKANRGK